MKKIICLIVSVVLMLSFCISTNAAGSSTVNGNNAVTVGNNIEFIVNVNGCGNATSIAVAITHSDKFELVSGTWLKSGSITKFDTATKKGALGGLSSPDVNGNLFKVVLKAKAATASNQTVSVNVIAKNGSTEIMNVTPTKSVKINCATHSYGSYTNANATNHTRTCSACGNVETKAHTWNGGSVTKSANCKETGTKTYTCTACNATKTETIAKTNNHSFSNWTTTKASDCTTAGTKSRSCSVCKKTETQTIKALGHNFSNPTVTKAPTCTETGIESGKCTRCNKTTTNTIAAKGHSMGEFTVTVEPTCTTEGKKEGTCTVCGEKAEEVVEKTEHTYGEAVVTKEATETEEGIKTSTCTVCGDEKQEKIPVIKKENKEDKKVSNEGNGNENKPDLTPWIVIAIAAVVIVAGVIVTIVIIKKKKA